MSELFWVKHHGEMVKMTFQRNLQSPTSQIKVDTEEGNRKLQ
jgi:hypothetical protein